MARNWEQIEAVPGFEGAEAFARRDIVPLMQAGDADRKPIDTSNMAKAIQLPAIIAFFGSVIGVQIATSMTPYAFLKPVVMVITFPVFFIGMILLMLRMFKVRVSNLLMSGRANFTQRAKGMTAIAEFLGLKYIPVPGGAPAALKSLAKWIKAEGELKSLVDTMDEHGGMEEAVDIAHRSGLMLTNTIILASAEKKELMTRQAATAQNLQDGFEGTRAGVTFETFEWVEPIEDQDDIHHLVLVLPSPSRLQGITELRSRKAGWPNSGETHDFDEVDLGARAFKDVFKLRSTDQTEARTVFNPAVMERVIELARDDRVRAVAFSEGLVIDVAGSDRFALSHILTGEWSEESIRTTFSDIADLVLLVEAAAHSFMLRTERGPA